ncbi:cob(I)yrinic acid a,c-diamide adenosyltransferase [Prochlorococcus marinus XMU1410]|uniref:cob(I)yrinic acid a,c-diamide adenosyltransferase n=1 Tax=Prochlorococcus marinus TaxID=1219 RepID=UPI001ADBF0D3|nr:cob(I)yrinic acid a,c-diamide adenosyltransferase [Prochlorococcus marinus]MBO8241556.1 cob(I)yrinic acid a,c-diamide adenosyltransferase [Prochlorococcus marinus XMU1410]MBW3052737.1 cob(I)yrinic acid a,c-diamide adenosyltransferase [Prochlorococcus marinus str. MU1410]
MKEKPSSSEKIFNLDNQANKLGMGGKLSPDSDESSYKKRMQRRKDIQAERLQNRNTKKGLLIVFTGNGKGKTTASLGMALRTIGHGYKVAIIQFIKGGWTTGEEKALKYFSSNLSWHSLGEGFTWETQDRIRDEKLVQEAWQLAKKYIQNESYKLIILDEINIATKLGYLAPEEIITFLKSLNNRKNHIVLTGRGASDSIINYADLVTEMKLIKHPFKEQGIKAQKCVEF